MEFPNLVFFSLDLEAAHHLSAEIMQFVRSGGIASKFRLLCLQVVAQ